MHAMKLMLHGYLAIATRNFPARQTRGYIATKCMHVWVVIV